MPPYHTGALPLGGASASPAECALLWLLQTAVDEEEEILMKVGGGDEYRRIKAGHVHGQLGA